MKISHFFRLLGLAAACLTAGCAEEIRFTVNANGSGKFFMKVDTEVLASMAGEPKPGEPSVEAQCYNGAFEGMRQLMSSTGGVEAWADPQITIDGKNTSYSMTAYFPDIRKLTMVMPNFAAAGMDGMQSQISADGKKWTLTAYEPPVAAPVQAGPRPERDRETEAENRREAREMRAAMEKQNAAFKEMAAQAPPDMGARLTFIPGGQILSAEGLKVANNQASVFVGLGEYITMMTKVLEDDEAIQMMVQEAKRQQVGTGNINWTRISPEAAAVREKLQAKYNSAPVTAQRLVMKPGPPVFDYATEVAAARAHPNDLLRKLRRGSATPARQEIPPRTELLGIQFGEGGVADAVSPNTPAARGLVKSGDHVVKIDGQPASSVEALATVRTRRPGQKVRLTIDRGDKLLELELTVPAPGDILAPR